MKLQRRFAPTGGEFAIGAKKHFLTLKIAFKAFFWGDFLSNVLIIKKILRPGRKFLQKDTEARPQIPANSLPTR